MPGVKGRSGGKRMGAGRIGFCPTDENKHLVKFLAGLGLRAEDIAQLVNNKQGKPISCDTLARYFSAELAKGRLESNIAVAKTLYEKAMKGDNTCMIFWLRTRAGWKDEPQRIEHSGPNGLPISTAQVNIAQFKKAVLDVTKSY
jgi:hypothetical protein